MNIIYTTGLSNGVLSIKPFVMLKENMPEMKTGMGFVRFMLIHRKVSGQYYVPG